jgi:hypothetical protein
MIGDEGTGMRTGTGAFRRVVGVARMSTPFVSLLRVHEVFVTASGALPSSKWLNKFVAVGDQHAQARRWAPSRPDGRASAAGNFLPDAM